MATNHEHMSAADRMAEACSRWLGSLSPEQKGKATFQYEDGERVFWYYPPLNRHGLALRDMDEGQRKLAYAIMASGLNNDAYTKATQIIDHEVILGGVEIEQNDITFVRDPELYYFTVFGEPGSEKPWAWRAEGHHISLHFSIWDGKVISTTPFFFGANPSEVRKGPQKGMRILGEREDLAFELMNSLDSAQRSKAVIYDSAPLDILTYNSSKVSLPREEGLPGSRMSGTQKEMLMGLVTEYVSQVSSDVAQEKLASLREEGLDKLHLAWGGPIQMGTPHYYRLHGGNFVVEFDNRQDGSNHIHSVWRDVENDFAIDVMREHLLLYHII